MSQGKTVVIGVSGGSGSGKTTFCRELVAALGVENVQHIKQDNYYRDLSHLSPAERDAVNFDHPQALEFSLLGAHLQRLSSGLDIDVPDYDFSTHTRRAETSRLQSKPVILIEGILIFSQPDILRRLNHSIFVDAPESVRLERRIKRDIEERGRTAESVRAQFFTTVAPMHNIFVEPSKQMSQWIISGEQPFDDFVQRLCSKLKSAIEK